MNKLNQAGERRVYLY